METVKTESIWGVRCYRSGGSIFGAAEAWAKRDGGRFEGTEEEARAFARDLNESSFSSNVSYSAKPIEASDE